MNCQKDKSNFWIGLRLVYGRARPELKRWLQHHENMVLIDCFWSDVCSRGCAGGLSKFF